MQANGDYIRQHEHRIAQLEKRLDGVEQSIEELQRRPQAESTPVGVIDESVLARISNLEQAMQQLQDQLNRFFKQLQDELVHKADKSDLAELERILMERINEIISALTS